jgi:hypothetical protein
MNPSNAMGIFLQDFYIPAYCFSPAKSLTGWRIVLDKLIVAQLVMKI